MQTNLKVYRYDPESGAGSSYQDYALDLPEYATVLDGLLEIRDVVDGTLSLRCSCRSAICGSCSMRINGQARLACKTVISRLVASEGEEISVEPMGNMPIVKDLVVDMAMFWNKVNWVQPWLLPKTPAPEREYLVSNEAMADLAGALNCIMCGVCVSDCTVLEVDSNFIGPAALAKAWRFTEDPRDGKRDERLKALNDEDGGIWDCTRCLKCVEVCPKGVAPMDRIMELREAAIEAGNTNTHGYHHSESFYNSVKKNGRLDETRLAIDSAGMFNIPRMLDLVPIGLAAMRKGKLPPPMPHKSEDHKKVRELYDSVEGESK